MYMLVNYALWPAYIQIRDGVICTFLSNISKDFSLSNAIKSSNTEKKKKKNQKAVHSVEAGN